MNLQNCHVRYFSPDLLWRTNRHPLSHAAEVTGSQRIDCSLLVCCTFRSEYISSVKFKKWLVKAAVSCSPFLAWSAESAARQVVVLLRKDISKKKFIVKFGPCRLENMRDGISCKVCTWWLTFTLSLNADRRNEKVNVAVRTTAAPQQRCYRCRPHQRTPRAEEDAVFIWRFKSLPLSCLFPAFYIHPPSWFNRQNRWRIVDFAVICESLLGGESAFQNTSRLTCCLYLS